MTLCARPRPLLSTIRLTGLKYLEASMSEIGFREHFPGTGKYGTGIAPEDQLPFTKKKTKLAMSGSGQSIDSPGSRALGGATFSLLWQSVPTI